MKKIPTLFVRQFENHRIVKITNTVTSGFEFILEGYSFPTVKWDGACCAVIDGRFYRRYDAKQGKLPPKEAIPCCDPDPVTGHWPHWLPCKEENPADKWFFDAFRRSNSASIKLNDGTYEAVGPHFQNNPYELPFDMLLPHGNDVIADLMRCPGDKLTFEEIRDYLEHHLVEGIVFWKDSEPVCKIKRTDFGFPWPP